MLHCLQVGVVWGVILVLWKLPWLISNWSRVLVSLVATGIVVLILWLAGPLIMSQVVMPGHHPDIDHRMTHEPGTTNKDGVRPDVPPEKYRKSDFVIIFIGDSYTYGDKVEFTKAFPAVVEERLKAMLPGRSVRVVNFGWVSSSPLLQYRQLKEIGHKYKPDLVVQSLDMTDIYDDLVYWTALGKSLTVDARDISIFEAMLTQFSKYFGVDDFIHWIAAKMEISLPGSLGIKDPYKERFFHLARPLSETRVHYERTWGWISKAYLYSKDMGARFALFILPRYQQYNKEECPKDWEKKEWPQSDKYLMEPFKFFAEKARSAPFPVHSLLDAFLASKEPYTVFDDDPHYDDPGHRVAAGAMVRHLHKSGLLPR